ncbi:MAG: lipoate--protein ligase family protein [Gemmataceae bacterium]|nr:lipoate--protein ligase family protein [Gemmataceae bacterium]
MPPRLRLLPFESDDAPTNMAKDEALLKSTLEKGVASLRFYTWLRPTLSLGYFQQHMDRIANKLATVDWVRRPTGGAAILHHHELTYSLSLPAGEPWHNSENWLCRFHHVISNALAPLGFEAQAVQCGQEEKFGPFLCFLHHTPADLRIGQHKVVGSAQRRPHGATLQHGSILLRRSEYTPQLLGLVDLAQRPLSITQTRDAILAELIRETQWMVEPSDWTTEEQSEIQRLIETKYATVDWNEKR